MEQKKTTLRSKIEALLFASGRALSLKQMAKLIDCSVKEIDDEVDRLTAFYEEQKSGLALLRKEKKVQLVSNPHHGKLVESFLKEEFTGPLSRAALETLALVAYRGPITKPAIDMVRGVNSAIMLRTLLIRGLVDRKKSVKDARMYVYSLSFDFMRHLGVTKIEELPDYDQLHLHEVLEKFTQKSGDANIRPDNK